MIVMCDWLLPVCVAFCFIYCSHPVSFQRAGAVVAVIFVLLSVLFSPNNGSRNGG